MWISDLNKIQKKNGYQHDCNLKMFIFNGCKKKELLGLKYEYYFIVCQINTKYY